MPARHPASILTHFASLPDPRRERRRLQRLLDMVAIALRAVVAGCDDGVEVAAYGRQKLGWFKTFLPLPHGIPGHDTFRRVFGLLDPPRLPALLHALDRGPAIRHRRQAGGPRR